MREAIGAYRHVAASPEFREIERMRSKARHDEAQALKNAERRGEERGIELGIERGIEIEREKWQSVATENEELHAKLAELRAQLGKN